MNHEEHEGHEDDLGQTISGFMTFMVHAPALRDFCPNVR
jgi:hypothetical protein